MVRIEKHAWTVGVLLGLVSWVLSGCNRSSSESALGIDAMPLEPVCVQTVKVERTLLKPFVELPGSIVAIPERSSTITPQVTGWIQKVLVADGDTVRWGDELLRFDSRLMQSELAKATATVGERTAVVERFKRGPRAEELEVARHDVHKAQAAVETLEGEVGAMKNHRSNAEMSPAQFQRLEAALQGAETECASAEARLKLLQAGTRAEDLAEAEARLASAQAELATAKLNLQFCTVTSPIDGTVTQLTARQGMYLDRPIPLATVVDLSKLYLQLRLPSAYLPKVKLGAKVDVRLTSLPDRSFSGVLARISGQADPGSGDIEAHVLVSNDEGVLRPGVICRGQIWLPEIAEANVVPASAIIDRAGSPAVQAIRGGKSYAVPVKVGARTRDQVEIVAGLAPGDLIIAECQRRLRDGCPVEAPGR